MVERIVTPGTITNRPVHKKPGEGIGNEEKFLY
jgi:hypothetical protein